MSDSLYKQSDLDELLSMGFEKDSSIIALEFSKGDLQNAICLLLSGNLPTIAKLKEPTPVVEPEIEPEYEEEPSNDFLVNGWKNHLRNYVQTEEGMHSFISELTKYDPELASFLTSNVEFLFEELELDDYEESYD